MTKANDVHSLDRESQPRDVYKRDGEGRGRRNRPERSKSIAFSNSLVHRLAEHRCAIAILLVYLATATVFSLAIPIWEAYDEDGHYQYAHYLLRNARLPSPGDPDAEAIWEKFQPPLYYWAAAGVMRVLGIDEPADPITNPYMYTGVSGVNYAIHEDSERMPYQGIALAVHVVRIMSVLIGAVSVVFSYLIGLTVSPGRKLFPCAIMLLHATWPQFLFNSSVITNDVLAAAMGSIVTYSILKCWHNRVSILSGLSMGLVLALAMLSKVNAIAMIPVAAFVLILSSLRGPLGAGDGGRWRHVLTAIAFTVPIWGAFVAIREMPFVRLPTLWQAGASSGTILMGEGSRWLANVSGGLAWDAVRYMAKTCYASFGWGNVELPQLFYHVALTAQGLALFGCGLALVRARPGVDRLRLLTCGIVAAAVALLVIMLATFRGDVNLAPGRYLLPGISAYITCLVIGGASAIDLIQRKLGLTQREVGANAGRLLTKMFKYSGLTLAVFAAIIPFVYIRPVYARPLVTGDVVDSIRHPVSVVVGDSMELLGFDILPNPMQAGERVEIVLYWRCLAQMKQNYTVSVKVLDADRHQRGSIESYPGRGNMATSLWRQNDIIRDVYEIWLDPDYPANTFAQISLRVYSHVSDLPRPITDGAGRFLGTEIVMGVLRVDGAAVELPETAVRDDARFGEAVLLLGYQVPDTLRIGEAYPLRFYWKAVKPMDVGYTVFVHLVDRQRQIVTQDDSPPNGGRFPTTLWLPGDVIEDTHTLQIPSSIGPGEFTVEVGMYRADTMERLALEPSSAESQQQDKITIAVKVVE